MFLRYSHCLNDIDSRSKLFGLTYRIIWLPFADPHHFEVVLRELAPETRKFILSTIHEVNNLPTTEIYHSNMRATNDLALLDNLKDSYRSIHPPTRIKLFHAGSR
jgi:hypothetical protein